MRGSNVREQRSVSRQRGNGGEGCLKVVSKENTILYRVLLCLGTCSAQVSNYGPRTKFSPEWNYTWLSVLSSTCIANIANPRMLCKLIIIT